MRLNTAAVYSRAPPSVAGGIRPRYRSGPGNRLGLRRRHDAQADPGRALQARHAGHDPFDRLALEHLVLEQLVRERVELGAVGDDHLLRGPAGFLDQILALLVADPQRGLRQPHVAVGRAPHAGGAHRVVVDHRVGDVGDALEVVRGAGGDRAEDDLLGHAAAEQHGHVVEQLLARLQIAVLGRQVQRVAERPPARDDRDAVHAVDRRQQLAAQRVPGLVVGDDPLLVLVQHALGLHAGDHPLERRVEVRRS